MSDEHEHEHGEHTDPTFYRSPRDAAAAPPEQLAYVAAFARPADKPDAVSTTRQSGRRPHAACRRIAKTAEAQALG